MEDLADEAHRVEPVLVKTPEEKEPLVVPKNFFATSSLAENSPEVPASIESPVTYAQVLSVNRFVVLQGEKNEVVHSEVGNKRKLDIIIPCTMEVWNTIQRAQQQIERDLQIIRESPVEEVDDIDNDLEGFGQAKSRSLKKFNNKTKSFRQKVIFSAGKHTHSYSLRGVSK